MNESSEESFVDLNEDIEVMEEESARELFEKMLKGQGPEFESSSEVQISDSLIKDFKSKTNLSIRKIAAITGVNKDKINKILRG